MPTCEGPGCLSGCHFNAARRKLYQDKRKKVDKLELLQNLTK